MNGEVTIYDSRDGSVKWRGVLESPDGQVWDQAFPENVTPGEVLATFVDRDLMRWRRAKDPYTDVPPPDESDGPQEPVDDSELEEESHPSVPEDG